MDEVGFFMCVKGKQDKLASLNTRPVAPVPLNVSNAAWTALSALSALSAFSG